MATYQTIFTETGAQPVIHPTGSTTVSVVVDLFKLGPNDTPGVANDVIELFQIPQNATITNWAVSVGATLGGSSTCDIGTTATPQKMVATGLPRATDAGFNPGGHTNVLGKAGSVPYKETAAGQKFQFKLTGTIVTIAATNNVTASITYVTEYAIPGSTAQTFMA